MDQQELADRLQLKELVDSISLQADKKDIRSQVQLFSEDILCEVFAEGKAILSVKGRQEMEANLGAKYQDDFIRTDSRWLICKRIGYFEWQEKHEIG